jgi:hypothetical protein
MNYSAKINRIDEYDFVVCGGGPSGFAAALSAARKGVKTAIIEKLGCLGGVATSGGISSFLGGRKLMESSGEHVRVVGGIFDEITDKLIAQGDAIEPNTINLAFNPFGWYPRMASVIPLDENALKILLDELCAQNGIRVYYYTDLCGAVTEDNRISRVIVHNKDGFIAIGATLFADCTGDGDLAEMSGCELAKGRKSDGLMTPASLEMQLDHVDGAALVTYQNEHRSPKLVEIIENLRQRGVWRFPYEIFVCTQLLEKDVFLINTIRQIGVDGTDEQSVSLALARGRRENLELFRIITEFFPGFQNARIRKICDWVGVRETRRIKGRYTISVADALSGKKYHDCVAATTYNFDLPDPLRPSYDPMMGDAKQPNAVRKHIVIQIPYRSLLPRSVTNLIVAGRCISAEREVLGPIRIMGPCMQMGQAAGTAAAIGLKDNVIFQAVDIGRLRSTLWSDGVINPEELPFD